MRYSVLALMLCGLAVAAQAQIYKWKDADGSVHYSDQPPTNAQTRSQVVNVKAQAVSGYSAAKGNASAPANAASAVAASSPAQVAAAQKDPALCKQYSDRLNYLQTATKLQSINEKGNIEMLDANRRASETTIATQNIAKYCP
ncbi:hypothetical protein JCM19000A_03100 [Silvimonas sp. JCM 19000]